MKNYFCATAILLTAMGMPGCSPGHFIGRETKRDLLQQPELRPAQVGISLYDPASASYLYNYQADKYFVPASNTKLFALYAGLKCLGDSLVGIRYLETDTALFISPAGDPTLLHPAFMKQPVIALLQKTSRPIYLIETNWQEQPLGSGWAWDDYNEAYMAERSPLPVYGNTIRWVQEMQKEQKQDSGFEASPSFYSLPEVDWTVRFTTDAGRGSFFVRRDRGENIFRITEGKEKYKMQDVPFITNGDGSAILLLKDTIGKTIGIRKELPAALRNHIATLPEGQGYPFFPGWKILHSGPVDSLFRPMMFKSDNFFAEQTLLMAGNERLGKMNDAAMIDDLLKNDLKELPQRPVWVDGSGLSRMDLFTPRDFVWLLDKMSRDFSLSRMERLLPTGGRGTLANYYKSDSAFIFAKTGSLTGIVSISGYLVTVKGRLLIFSILVNHHDGSAAAVRRKVEKWVHAIREKY